LKALTASGGPGVQLQCGRHFTSGLVFAKVASVKVKEQNRHGRLVEVIVDGKDVSKKLLKGGLPRTSRSTRPTPGWPGLRLRHEREYAILKF